MMNSLFVQTIIAYLLIFAVPLVLPFAFLKLVGLSGLRTLVTYEAKDTRCTTSTRGSRSSTRSPWGS